MAPDRIVGGRACGRDCRKAGGELAARRAVVMGHDDRGAQAMVGCIGRVAGERTVDLGGRIAAMGQQHVEGTRVMRPRGLAARRVRLCRVVVRRRHGDDQMVARGAGGRRDECCNRRAGSPKLSAG
jgi:hypothetical protein